MTNLQKLVLTIGMQVLLLSLVVITFVISSFIGGNVAVYVLIGILVAYFILNRFQNIYLKFNVRNHFLFFLSKYFIVIMSYLFTIVVLLNLMIMHHITSLVAFSIALISFTVLTLILIIYYRIIKNIQNQHRVMHDLIFHSLYFMVFMILLISSVYSVFSI
jgi:hypothetical protein